MNIISSNRALVSALILSTWVRLGVSPPRPGMLFYSLVSNQGFECMVRWISRRIAVRSALESTADIQEGSTEGIETAGMIIFFAEFNHRKQHSTPPSPFDIASGTPFSFSFSSSPSSFAVRRLTRLERHGDGFQITVVGVADVTAAVAVQLLQIVTHVEEYPRHPFHHGRGYRSWTPQA